MRYRLQRHDGTDCSATMVPITVLRMVPIQRYRQLIFLIHLYKEDTPLSYNKYAVFIQKATLPIHFYII